MKPFFSYFGSKHRIISRYPKPQYEIIVEPFAGSAAYASAYPDRKVLLVEKYALLADMWAWLITVSEAEFRGLPDNPEDASGPAATLIGLNMQGGRPSPRKKRASATHQRPWNQRTRDALADQLCQIRHWKVLRGSYVNIPGGKATWFVDPPYEKAGAAYVENSSGIDFAHLAQWCKARQGQTIVCENVGATWLPFRTFGTVAGGNGRLSKEAIWVKNQD